MFHHVRSLDAPAEGQAGIFFRINSCGLEHVRVKHSSAAQLEPTALANSAFLFLRIYSGSIANSARHVDFKRRFGETEMMRAQTRFAIRTKKLTREIIQCAAKMRNGNAFVHVHYVDLMKHRHVRHVVLSAICFNYIESANRRFIFRQTTRSAARRLCREQHASIFLMIRSVKKNVSCVSRAG